MKIREYIYIYMKANRKKNQLEVSALKNNENVINYLIGQA
jgi:hypothetical protein